MCPTVSTAAFGGVELAETCLLLLRVRGGQGKTWGGTLFIPSFLPPSFSPGLGFCLQSPLYDAEDFLLFAPAAAFPEGCCVREQCCFEHTVKEQSPAIKCLVLLCRAAASRTDAEFALTNEVTNHEYLLLLGKFSPLTQTEAHQQGSCFCNVLPYLLTWFFFCRKSSIKSLWQY